MIIISKTILLDFSRRHASALEPLNAWYELTKQADWKNFSEMRQTFNSVDALGNDRYVFNIKGNRFRLVAIIHLIYARFISALLVHTLIMIKLIVRLFNVYDHD